MRKYLLGWALIGLLILLGLAWSSEETTQPENVKGPLQVSELNWDFGYVPAGSSVTHRFVLKNVGDKLLKITKVRPACGCTSAPLSKSDLEPGEATDLEVTFNARNFRGKSSKSVAIMTDDTTTQVINLQFSCDVGSAVPTLIFEPQDVNFDTVALGHKASKRLKITNNDIQPISLKLVEFPQGLLDAKLKKEKLSIGAVSELTLNLVNKNKTEGYFNKTITMEVDGHVDYRVSLSVSGTLVNGSKKN